MAGLGIKFGPLAFKSDMLSTAHIVHHNGQYDFTICQNENNCFSKQTTMFVIHVHAHKESHHGIQKMVHWDVSGWSLKTVCAWYNTGLTARQTVEPLIRQEQLLHTEALILKCMDTLLYSLSFLSANLPLFVRRPDID